MSIRLGDIVWTEKEFTQIELNSIFESDPPKIKAVFNSVNLQTQKILFEFLIANKADGHLLVDLAKKGTKSDLAVESLLNLVPVLIFCGEISLAHQNINKIYKIISKKNLLNKIKPVQELRQQFFPLDVDFMFKELLFYFENNYIDAVVTQVEAIEELFMTSWRKLDKTKTKMEYRKAINDLYKYYQELDYRFYKNYLLSKGQYTKKEKTKLLLLSASEPSLMSIIFEKMNEDQKKLMIDKLGFKKGKITKGIRRVPLESQKHSNKEYEIKGSKRIDEKERLLLVQNYLSSQTESQSDETYILSLIKSGHFDKNENIGDLIIGFFNINYLKAIDELINKYSKNEYKLIYAELLLSINSHTEAKALASEVIASKEKDLELLDWAKKVLINR